MILFHDKKASDVRRDQVEQHMVWSRLSTSQISLGESQRIGPECREQ